MINKIWKNTLITALTAALIITFNTTPAIASENDASTYASSATAALQTIMERQYSVAIEDVKRKTADSGYDFQLTIETAEECGNPFKNMDYVRIISNYAAIKSYLAQKGRMPEKRLSDIPFISYTVSDNTVKESLAVKIPEYEEIQDGVWVKKGFHYATSPETVFIYEDNNDGTYHSTGRTKTIEPETKDTSYYSVSFNVIKAEEIFNHFDVKEEEVEDIAAVIRNKIEQRVTNEELNQSVFLTFPDDETETWTENLSNEITELEEEGIVEDGEVVAAIASSLQGMVPYEWGGKPSKDGYDSSWWTYNTASGLQKGLDCSGFVKWAYMTAGYAPEVTAQLNSTSSMLMSGMQEIDRSELEPGDIGIVERPTVNHCGIYAGDGQWLHCSSHDDTVIKSDYNFTRYFRPEGREDTDFTKYEQYLPAGGYSDDDVMTLARLVSHEADNQGLNGWAAVAEVVLNRIDSPLYPDTIEDVIYQEGQFTGSNRSRLSSITPRPEIVSTVRAVLSRRMSVLGNSNVLYFRNPGKKGNNNWGKHHFYTAIGQHAFYLQ